MIQAVRIHSRGILVGALVVVLAAFVWPTPFHYSSYRTVPVRISRMTGRAEILTPNGWHMMMTPTSTAAFDAAWAKRPAASVFDLVNEPRHYSPDNPFARFTQRSPHAALKIAAALTSLLGLLLGFLERRYRPHARVTSDSPRYPPWLAWLGWSLTAAGVIGYVAIDFLSARF